MLTEMLASLWRRDKLEFMIGPLLSGELDLGSDKCTEAILSDVQPAHKDG